MNSEDKKITLGEGATLFLAELTPEEKVAYQQDIYKFVRWYGWEYIINKLTAPEVANYAERLSQSDTDYEEKLEIIRAFLAYTRKKGWCRSNLASHLKTRKTKNRIRNNSRKAAAEIITLTQQGYDELNAELNVLRSKRLQAIEEMRLAAADKDFSENAPLDAAKEKRGQIEGRIMELEETLKSAVIIQEKPEDILKVNIGDSVVLRDLVSGDEIRYTLVNPREVDPARGKISDASPIGKAAIGKGQGDTVEVTVPAGRLTYEILQIER